MGNIFRLFPIVKTKIENILKRLYLSKFLTIFILASPHSIKIHNLLIHTNKKSTLFEYQKPPTASVGNVTLQPLTSPKPIHQHARHPKN